MRITGIISVMIALTVLVSCSSKEEASTVPGVREISIATEVVSHVDTRASLITSANLAENRIHIEAYTHGKATNYLSSNALFDESLTKWVFFKGNFRDYRYYWPDFNLDFFAYSPYTLSGTRVSINAYSDSDEAPSFTYEGVSPINETGQADLKEMLCAYKSNCNYTGDNPVKLKFHHPFSIVSFKIGESIRCSIREIKITNIYNRGTAMPKDADSGPYFVWTPSGDKTNLVISYAGNGISYPDEVNSDSDLSVPYIIVPQSLSDDSMIEVTYKAQGSSNFTTVKSSLNKAILKSDNQNERTAVSGWKPGNRYTYALKLNGSANELYVAVAIEGWVSEGNTDIEIK